jgi:AraC-like DNA-binding protein
MKGVSRWSHIQYQMLGGLDVFSLFSPPYQLDRYTAERVREINEQLVALNTDNVSIHNHIKKASLVFDLLALIANISEKRSDYLDIISGAKRLYPALSFISKSFSECVDIKELAAMCSLSRSRFDFVFTKIVGTAPGKYIQNLKLRSSQVLLATSDLAIYEVAKQSGFQDVFHFSRLFKAHTSLSPSAYRNQIRNRIM